MTLPFYLFLPFICGSVHAQVIPFGLFDSSGKIDGTIGSIDCSNMSQIGTKNEGVVADGITVTKPYTRGNTGLYRSQSYTATGISGLMVTIGSGSVTASTGQLIFSIYGTPSSTGTASFFINICGQS